MKRPDVGLAKFALWLGASTALSFTVFWSQTSTFFALLDGSLNDTFGTSFPAIPFAALLGVLFVLRWKDFHSVLSREAGLTTRPYLRISGIALVLLPLSFARFATGSIEVSAVSLIMVFYGASLAVIPEAARMLLPYAGLYVGGVVAPAVLQTAFGEPLAGLATWLSSILVGATGIPVVWNGNAFTLVSTGGELVSATITPGCSSILSVTTFLGLLGLMYYDFRRKPGFTLTVAAAGVAVLVLLNSLRIGILIWAGYSGGTGAIWGTHNWVGYAIFLGFYLGVLVVYSGAWKSKTSAPIKTPVPGDPIPLFSS